MTESSEAAADGTTLVIPCYNEANRLPIDDVRALLKETHVRILFVDDGSDDRTGDLLAGLVADDPGRLELLQLPTNVGKAEAVRQGLLHAMDRGATVVGYTDADFATPANEVAHLVEIITEVPVEVVLGCRVARLGSNIERSTVRHYGGRLFATLASIALRMTVYDTQCGAKVFRVSDHLRSCLSKPFESRWAFDVELLDRLRWGVDGMPGLEPDQFVELPLESWRHVGGSKLDARGSADAFAAVFKILWRRRSASPRR